MTRTTIASIFADAERLGGQTLTVAGWARSIRDSKAVGFVALNDGSCFANLQVVLDRGTLPNYDEIAGQNVGAALIVTGTLVLTPEAQQPFELKATEIAVEGPSAPDYPLQKKRHTVEFLRTIAAPTPAHQPVQCRVPRALGGGLRRARASSRPAGSSTCNTPIITASDCEGAGEMFRVTALDMANVPLTDAGEVDYSQDFFGKAANLTVSGQLQAENFAMAFGNVYTFGPTFRAENSNTQRHAAEFWMIEPEIAFADLEDDMDLAEELLKYVIRTVMEKCPDEMNFFNSFVDKGLKERLEHVASSDFGRVTYTEAVEILEQAARDGHEFEFPVYWGCDLADRARALPHRAALQEARVRDRLPRRDQGVLHAPQRRRQNRGSLRLPGSRHRRDRGRRRSAKSGSTCSRSASWKPACRLTTTNTTATCAASAGATTPASAWALSAS